MDVEQRPVVPEAHRRRIRQGRPCFRRGGRVGDVERAFVDRIERLNGTVNAVVTLPAWSELAGRPWPPLAALALVLAAGSGWLGGIGWEKTYLLMAAAMGLVVGLKALRRTLRFAGRDPRTLASACRKDIVGFLADQGFELPPSASLAEIGEALDRYYAIDASSFVRSASVARFARPSESDAAVVRARRELRRMRRDLRHQLSATSRFRGAISLRSLTL